MEINSHWLFMEEFKEYTEEKKKELMDEWKKEMDYIRTKQKCLCGRGVSGDVTIYDHGPNCGIECTFCK